MGWSIGYDNHWKRDVGYGVPATCDHPRCNAKIDRGLAYVCGGEPFGGEQGCGLHFCGKHLRFRNVKSKGWSHQNCFRCSDYKKPYTPKSDLQEWIDHKMTDPSWEDWRTEQNKKTGN